MNRMYLALLVFTLLAAFTSTPAAAQTDTEKQPAVGTTKVAVVNIGVIFHKYDRASAFKKELEHNLKELKAEAKQLTENLSVWQSSLQKGDLSAAKKEKYEEKIIIARRRLEDMNRSAGQSLGKSQEANLIILWKDVRAAVKDYAAKHGIDLVIAYGDPLDRELLDLFPNINRKMQSMDAGGSLPFFIGSRVDISEGVVAALNRQFRERDDSEKAEPEDK